MIRAVGAGINTLHPAYFALVMATGIVAIAGDLAGFVFLSQVLTYVNIVAYVILWMLTVWRVVWYRRSFMADISDHGRSVGFFTMIAGTNVLGNQLVVVFDVYTPARLLLVVGVVLWVFITYTIFTALTVKEIKPTLGEGINGGWLLAVVATQSVASLTTILSSTMGEQAENALFFALCCWLFGGMLYIWLISLIFYRYTFFPLSAQALLPPYWINMGAMAISTLAGAGLILAAETSPFLSELLPFLKGFTVLYWATATWWIPMLLLLGFWRHVYKRYALIYDPLYWGAVFPLGMYTACSFRLGQAIERPFLITLAEYFVYIACAAWAVTFAGMLYSLIRQSSDGDGAIG